MTSKNFFRQSRGSFTLDHSYEGYKLKHVKDCPDDEEAILEKFKETPEQTKARKASHWVAYTTMFIMTVGFSIVLTGVGPYMVQVDDSITSKTALGWVVAVNPLGQMIASPLLGMWSNKIGTVRIPCISMVVVYIIGNALYSVLYIFQDSPGKTAYFVMIFSRFLVGASSGNVSLCRSYIASSTTLDERTLGMAIMSGSQALGFVVGPIIQAITAAAIKEPIQSGIDWLVLDEYTACGWLAAVLGIINFIILLPCIFTEYSLIEQEEAKRKMLNKDHQKEEEIALPKPDALPLIGILFGFFVAQFIYTLLEAMAVPFVIDQYFWDEDQAMIVVGIALAVGGFLSIIMFVGTGMIAKVFDERKVIIIIGYLPLVIGCFLLLPWGSEPIGHPDCLYNTTATTEISAVSTSATWAVSGVAFLRQTTNTVMNSVTQIPEAVASISDEVREVFYSFLKSVSSKYVWESDILTHSGGGGAGVLDCPGCPLSQEWCDHVPPLPQVQLAIGFIIIMMGYPSAISMAQAIMSKILGPRPQGVWMGVLTGVGSFARVLGPIYVTYVYSYYGTYWAFGTLTVLMAIAGIELSVLYRRLVPMKLPEGLNLQGFDNPAAMAGGH